MSHGGQKEDCLLVKHAPPSGFSFLDLSLIRLRKRKWFVFFVCFFIPPVAKERFTAWEVRMWQTTCHATTFLSLLKDCVLLLPLFVFKWTVNDLDVSVGTLAIRESTPASIPCQGLSLNWRAAVKLTRTRDGHLQFACSLSQSHGAQRTDEEEEEGARSVGSRPSLTRRLRSRR